jgi:hypothetical protein
LRDHELDELVKCGKLHENFFEKDHTKALRHKGKILDKKRKMADIRTHLPVNG